jgi:hypothetical protein
MITRVDSENATMNLFCANEDIGPAKEYDITRQATPELGINEEFNQKHRKDYASGDLKSDEIKIEDA